MARIFSGLFGSKKQTQQPSGALRISTSLQGIPIPLILAGQNRLPCNCIWTGGFNFTNAPAQGGGKGGLVGAGGKGNSGNYIYFTDVLFAVCEGPIASFVGYVLNGALSPIADLTDAALFLGTYPQAAWGYLEAKYPTQALGYPGIAYVGFDQLNLGSSPDLPQFNWEVLSVNNTAIPGQPDGDPKDAWLTFLTNGFFGVGFPSSRVDQQLTQYSSYCRALGLVVSPVLAAATQASSFCNDLLTATNADAAWYDGFLTVVPRGDQAVTAGSIQSITENHTVPAAGIAPVSNPPPYSVIIPGFIGGFVNDQGVKYHSSGTAFTFTSAYPPSAAGTYTIIAPGAYVFAPGDIGQSIDISYQYAAQASYTPDNTPLWDFTIDDYLPNQGTIGQGVSSGNNAIIAVRKPRDQMLNSIKLTYHDRNSAYNPVTIEVKDEASIVAYKRYRPSDVKDVTFFCLGSAASQSALLQLIREQIPTTFQWTAGKRFILCTVTKLVTLTGLANDGRKLFRQLVKIMEVQENADSTLTFTGEMFPGTAAAPEYGAQAAAGTQLNFNADPGSVNQPILFEPTDELGSALIPGGGLMIAAAVSGQKPSLWGGCKVFASYDNATYNYVGTVNGPARMGVTTADFPAVAINATGQTIDQTSTLSVDLSESQGALVSGSALDATSLNTRCYVGPFNGGGEIIAFETAALTATFKYGLSYLIRGAYGTEDEIADHPAGSAFCRLDGQILAIPYDQSRIGATLYLKFVSFNLFQGGEQQLNEVAPYTYVISGSALASPLPDVTGSYTNYEAGFQKWYWDEIDDFRNGIVYEIRQGVGSWDSALPIRTQAHPPFIFQGNGTFQAKARCQPIAGLTVYSENATTITVAGNQLSLNLLAGFDEKASGWTGTFQNGIGVDGGDLRLGGSANVLAENPFLQSATTSVATPSGNILGFATLGTVTVGMAVADTAGVIPAGTVVTAINPTGVIDYGLVASPATSFADDGSAAGGATGFTDYGSVATAVGPNVTLSAPVTAGGVLAGDTIVFSIADVLDSGGVITGAPVYYTIPAGHIINAGSVVQASVNATTLIVGVPVGQNVLNDPNRLTNPDVLGSSSTQYVDGWIEIGVSQDGVTWGGWQKFVPGVYPGMAWNFRLALLSNDPKTIGYALAFNYQVQLPSRIDHYQNQSVSSVGLTITFARDAAPSTPAPFNGGPGSADLPYYSVSNTNPFWKITGLSLSQLTITFYTDATYSTPTAATGVNVDVEGY